MKKVDLHVHSNVSDGTLSPREVVKAAKNAYLSAMALTDHDTVNGIPEAILAGKEFDIEIIPGIEMSSFYKDREIHIVGLCVDYKDPNFLASINDEISNRTLRNKRMIKKCNDFGFEISINELKELFPQSVITRAHFAKFFMQKNYVKSIKEAFDKYFGDGMPLYVPRDKKTAKQTIEIIKSAKGVPILAHPLLYKFSSGELKNLCIELKTYGLVGIESMYSTHRGFDELTVRHLAHEVGLLESGGSDFHGANKPYIAIGIGTGNLMIHYDFLKQIKNASNYYPSE